MTRFSFDEGVDWLSGAGFGALQAREIALAFSGKGRPDRIDLLDGAVDAAAGGLNYMVDVGIDGSKEIAFSPTRVAALCHWMAGAADFDTRLWLVDKLGSSRMPRRVSLLSLFLEDPEPTIQDHASGYLAKSKVPIHELLRAMRSGVVMPRSDQDVVGWADDRDPVGVAGVEGGLVVPSVGRDALSGVLAAGPIARRSGSNPQDVEMPGSGKAVGVVPRFTQVEFRGAADTPQGQLSFALRVRPGSQHAHAVDVRMRDEQNEANVLVFASSLQFAVTPAMKAIKVYRNDNSEEASFLVDATRSGGDGAVSLLVYDEVGLLGSLLVPIKGVGASQQLRLTMADGGPQFHRDPATNSPAGSRAWTIQASFRHPDQRISFHVHRPAGRVGEAPSLLPLGASPERFDSTTVQQALEGLRTVVDQLEKELGNPEMLRSGTTPPAVEYLAMTLSGYGLKIGDDLLSDEVLALLAATPEGTPVQWVVADQALDAIPWELARHPITRRALNEHVVLVRTPAIRPQQADGPLQAAGAVAQTSSSRKLVYVLGDGVYKGADFDPVRQTVKAVKGHEIETNFDAGVRMPVTAVDFKAKAADADVVYILSHGNVDGAAGLYLELEQSLVGRLSPVVVRDVAFTRHPLVFVNACSSSTATFSVGGFTTFGWTFLQAGAGIFIGALAPVPTSLALRFAESFFEAHLGRGVTVPQAICETRRELAKGNDPTWILYTVYGDLSRMGAIN
jgi:hypothetical protein